MQCERISRDTRRGNYSEIMVAKKEQEFYEEIDKFCNEYIVMENAKGEKRYIKL